MFFCEKPHHSITKKTSTKSHESSRNCFSVKNHISASLKKTSTKLHKSSRNCFSVKNHITASLKKLVALWSCSLVVFFPGVPAKPSGFPLYLFPLRSKRMPLQSLTHWRLLTPRRSHKTTIPNKSDVSMCVYFLGNIDASLPYQTPQFLIPNFKNLWSCSLVVFYVSLQNKFQA